MCSYSYSIFNFKDAKFGVQSKHYFNGSTVVLHQLTSVECRNVTCSKIRCKAIALVVMKIQLGCKHHPRVLMVLS